MSDILSLSWFFITSKNPQCVVLGFDTTLNYNTLTGETKIKDLESSTIKPDIIIENLNELIELRN